jgi:hypothetical protein
MRACLWFAAFAAAICFAEGPQPDTVTGKLVQPPGKPPAIQTAPGKLIQLDGDEPTRGVLNDKRLAGFALEARGHFTAPDHFQVDPIHTRAILVRKDGKVKFVTYWCDICSIRTYTPGLCWCCQEETTLDLLDPDQADK